MMTKPISIAPVALRAALLNAINEVPAAFKHDPWNLAYLAVTSKPEGPLRDALACGLRSHFDPGLIVAREWAKAGRKRADIAVLDQEGQVLCLVECKVSYSFAALRGPSSTREYPAHVERDLRKAREAVQQQNPPAVFAVLWVAHVQTMEELKPSLAGVVKYASHLKVPRGTPEKRRDACKALDKALGELEDVVVDRPQSFHAGTAFELPVDFDCWLLETKWDQGTG